MVRLPRLMPLLVIAFAMSITSSARASDDMGRVEWDKLYWSADKILRDDFGSQSANRVLPEQRPAPQGLGNAWFGVDPKMSVVVRDWGEGYRLYGGPMALSDQLRLSRSTRMVVSRLRLGHGKIVPFFQAGVGQWRVDTTTLPALHYDIEIATQAGCGMEANIASNVDFVAETNTTFFMRDARDPGSVAATRVYGALFFSRIRF